MIYHVAKNGKDTNIGNESNPFLTINKAASIAMAGDSVIVHEGVYRENVNPKYAGLSDQRRITYMCADGETVVIKGSEVIDTWTHVEGSVWKVTLPNSFFGDFNPYKETVFGDWVVSVDKTRHLGDVYLNGMSFYESETYDAIVNPEIITEFIDDWTQRQTPVINPEQTKFRWYVESDENNTTIYANFQDANPNDELVEINVRQNCFYPQNIGIDYITVRGFELAQAASPWAPPTADQPGLIGAHWSKGWIIEDNIIHDAKCSAISIGKEILSGHNYRSIRRDKPGYIYQLESVFSAERLGWSKETIGSHIIRNNRIYDCGQNGIVGHLGCVFSEIYGNHIYNIASKREFYGHEIGGIKLHAAIDVQIHSNRIHDCSLGIWLDWQTQGTRISKNLLYNNNRDFFVEVSHGPYMVDHNIMASDYNVLNVSQGGAYVNNLFVGKMAVHNILDRSTQYHLPHSTKIKGFTLIYGGDDRFYNNLYLGQCEDSTNVNTSVTAGTHHYNGRPTSLDEYIEKVDEVPGDHESFNRVKQPVYIDNNVYLGSAKAFDQEKTNLIQSGFDTSFILEETTDGIYMSCTLPEAFDEFNSPIRSTRNLTRVRIVDAEFDNPDGSPMTLDTDYFNEKKSETTKAGPLNQLRSGDNKIKVW
jgi:hypothetical protein